MESSIEKTMKADKAEMSDDAEKTMEPWIERMLKADRAVMMDAEKRANFLAFVEECRIAEEKAAGKRKATTVMRRLTQKQIDAGWSEEELARVTDKDVRDHIRDRLAATAAVLNKSREDLRLEKERIREELRTQGYVTDDEGTDDEGSGDI